MSRARTICIATVIILTLGSAATYTIPHWNDPPVEGGSCMFPNDGPSNATLGGILCGIGGFIASGFVGPTAAAIDQRRRMKFADLQMQAQNNALSLLRASNVPPTQQQAELLRAAQAGPATPPQELLRATQTARSDEPHYSVPSSRIIIADGTGRAKT